MMISIGLILNISRNPTENISLKYDGITSNIQSRSVGLSEFNDKI